MKNRIKFISIFFILFWILLISRIYFLSIKSNRYYDELAKRNIVKTEYLTHPRGMIKDRNGVNLAVNKLGFSIYLIPHLTRKSKKKQFQQDLIYLEKYFPNLNQKKIEKIYKRADTPYNHRPIQIVNFINYNDLISKYVSFLSNKDFSIKPNSKRYYPFGSTASHVIGYVAKANSKDIEQSSVAKFTKTSGKNGIEKYYNTILEGELGYKKIKVTALNKEVAILKEKKSSSSNISLSIDIKLQKYLENIFEDQTGALIIMNAQDGSILAAASYPEYDINEFVEGMSQKRWDKMITDLNHPFTNKFIQGLYPPGSSTKPLVSLSFINSQLISERENFLCEGIMSVGRRHFRCWSRYGHGKTNMTKAIRESCDVYFYKGGLRVGIDKISTDLTRYGFGKKTFIDLPSEFIGTVPSRNWKIQKFGESWYKGETLNTVIGQGNFLVTPIQIAVATALVATSKQVTPHFIKKIGEEKIKYERRNILTTQEKKALPTIRKAMFEVCNNKRGTAYKYNSSIINIAGKTGTSQVVGIPQDEVKRMSEDDLAYFKKSHAWLTTYAPYKNPKYIITALVEHGGHGGSAAGDIISKVYNKLVQFGYIDKKYVKKEYLSMLEDTNSSKDLNISALSIPKK